MAIIKSANNMTLTVKGKHTISVGGKLEKTANKINIETTVGNLVLASNKKIVAHDNVK